MASCSSSAASSAADTPFSATPSRSSARPASSRITLPCSAPLPRVWPAAGRSLRDSRPSTRRSPDPSATRSTGASRSSCASRASSSCRREPRARPPRPRNTSNRRCSGRANKGRCPWSCGAPPASPDGGTSEIGPGRRGSSWRRSTAGSPRASTPPISWPRGRSSTTSGRPAVVQYGGSATVPRRRPMSDELMTKVQDLIENMINPAVAGHGGFVQLVDVKDNKVYLQMGGGCQGCGAADVTLKQGIERLIKEELPEIEEVLDTTDHDSGENPYYTPSK